MEEIGLNKFKMKSKLGNWFEWMVPVVGEKFKRVNGIILGG